MLASRHCYFVDGGETARTKKCLPLFSVRGGGLGLQHEGVIRESKTLTSLLGHWKMRTVPLDKRNCAMA